MTDKEIIKTLRRQAQSVPGMSEALARRRVRVVEEAPGWFVVESPEGFGFMVTERRSAAHRIAGLIKRRGEEAAK